MEVARTPLDEWKLQLALMPHRPQILLCGAKPWPMSCHLDHRKHCERADWITTDIESGEGVDMVHDLQTMWQETDQRFDAIFCPAVLEHIPRPWTAMHSMSQLLLPGGVLYIQTHQTFVLHGYPHDYFRFSREALELMATDSGLHPLMSGYDGPCTITPLPDVVWNPLAPSYLNVTICAKRPA